MRRFLFCLFAAVLAVWGTAAAQERRPREGSGGPPQTVPALPTAGNADVVLGRPTASSIVLSLLRYDRSGWVFVTYGTSGNASALRSRSVPLDKNKPQELVLDGLQADAAYRYELRDADDGAVLIAGGFHTQRHRGESFVFTVTADSHLDRNTDPALYRLTLANAAADAPDFHVDLGDTFMTDKHESRENAARQYLAQRIYLGALGRSSPLFLALGNHDGEDRRLRSGGGASLAVWANAERKTYFPNPQPDAFYSGNRQRDSQAGLLQDYYAWTWGDALFVVLDPYWHGSGRGNDDRWGLSLGDEQRAWLKATLEQSTARHKLVFIHQLVGGFNAQGRGGTEAAAYGEWGGRNADGTEGLRDHRPGWDIPIHELLVRNGVGIVFHGHDHLYARQILNGIVYQEVPQPGHPGDRPPPTAAEGGYQDGVILGGAGHLRVTVSPKDITVDFVRGRTTHDGGR